MALSMDSQSILKSKKIEEFFIQLEDLSVNARRRYEREVESFFSDLSYRQNIFNQYKKYFDIYLSSDFNIFDLISPDENKISDILADVLDPDGSHGQGNVFLTEFLNLLTEKGVALPKLDLKRGVTVTREQTTFQERRIDLLLKFESELVIGIENKPWASESEKQIEDYIKYIKNYETKDVFAFLFLHPTGKQPESIDENVWRTLEEEGKCKALSYKDDLIAFLKRCYEKCKSEKYRFFLQDFLTYIENKFTEVEDDWGFSTHK